MAEKCCLLLEHANKQLGNPGQWLLDDLEQIEKLNENITHEDLPWFKKDNQLNDRKAP
jgi:hypothetical protein